MSVSSVSNAISVTAGTLHSCSLLSNGTVQCWGFASPCEPGTSQCWDSYNSLPQPIIGIADASTVSAGFYHTCALLRSGSVKCWGDNTAGQLGDGTTTNSAAPVAVSGITNAVAMAAGGYQSCAVLDSGSIQCWGWNAHGQLGNDSTTDSPLPVT